MGIGDGRRLIPTQIAKLKMPVNNADLIELIEASQQIIKAYTPSHSNEWMYDDGYGVSHRRDWDHDDRALKRLKTAVERILGREL